MFAKITPVTPPTVNKNKKPRVQYALTLGTTRAPNKVASHEKIFTPVGTAIAIVAEVKYARVSTSIPTVNI